MLRRRKVRWPARLRAADWQRENDFLFFVPERIDDVAALAQTLLRSILISGIDDRRRSQPSRQPRSEEYSGLQLRNRTFSSSVSGEPTYGWKIHTVSSLRSGFHAR
jgi:hypothetical protein